MAMQKIIFLINLFLLGIFLSARAQDYEKLNRCDSLCDLIDADPAAIDLEFEIQAESEYYLPITRKIDVRASNNQITRVYCSFYEISKNRPHEYAFENSVEIYFDKGKILKFVESENTVFLDTNIIDLEERVQKGTVVLPWSLDVYFLNGELLYYFSNGHGITERDDFDAEIHSKDYAEYLKNEARKKFPELE